MKQLHNQNQNLNQVNGLCLFELYMMSCLVLIQVTRNFTILCYCYDVKIATNMQRERTEVCNFKCQTYSCGGYEREGDHNFISMYKIRSGETS